MRISPFFFFFFVALLPLRGQTILNPGDIAFISSNSDGTTFKEDNFAFVLLKDLEAGTQIHFTDRGWNDASGFLESPGDGKFTWSPERNMYKGEIVILSGQHLYPAAYSYIGDQIFAYQGEDGNPTFIAGLHTNVTPSTTDANWDEVAVDNATSALPDQLQTGVNALRFSIEFDNGQFSGIKAGGNIYSSTEEVRVKVNNLDNWNFNDDQPYFPSVEQNLAFFLGRPFVTTWKTDNPGGSSSTSITLPISTYDDPYSVDWNSDGIYDDTRLRGPITHDFGKPGTYTITVIGTDFTFNRPTKNYSEDWRDNKKLLSIDQWGDIRWPSMRGSFRNCINLEINATDAPDLSKVIDLSRTFWNCSSLNANLNEWNVKSVLDMSYIFDGASSFDQDLGKWNISSLQNARDAFRGVTLSSENYDRLLKGWSRLDSGETGIPTKVIFDAGGSKYCSAAAERQKLIDDYGWTITDGGLECIDREPPGGYSASINQEFINAQNQSSISFSYEGAEIGSTYTYSFNELLIGGENMSGSGEITQATGGFENIDLSGLSDGPVAFKFHLTDTVGNQGETVSISILKDTRAPSEYLITIDQDVINESNQAEVSFSFSNAEEGSTYNYIFSSTNGGADVTGSGIIDTTNQQITGIDVSKLGNGTLTLSVTLTDGSFNEGVAAIDTVVKNTNNAPVAICKIFAAQLGADGTVTIEASDVDGGSSDDKAGFTLSIDNNSFDCSNIGANQVHLTITDSDGVTDTCVATVTVEDNVSPVAATQNITVQLDADGHAVITPEMINNESSDACGIASMSLNVSSFGCGEIGTNYVTLSVTDPGGNTGTAEAVVEIINNFKDNDSDGLQNNCDTDDDNDGVIDEEDNSPFDHNPNQADTDGDGEGDASDLDDDNDSIMDQDDNCPLTYNPDQGDIDNNGMGDVCDTTKILASEAMTPNGDGVNDTWRIVNIMNYRNSLVIVYNRWGKEVYRVRSYQNDWNGTRDGKLLPEGSYYYQIYLEGNGKMDQDGWLYLIR